jgi:MAF protein
VWAYHRRTMIEPSTTPDHLFQDVQAVKLPPLVLASGSPRRAEILSSAGLLMDVRPADISEHRLPGDDTPDAWVVRLAEEKAAAVAGTNSDAVTLGADTIVVIDDEVLGKPSSREEAVATLRRLRNRTHHVMTAVALKSRNGKWSGYSRSVVKVRDMTDVEIDQYVESGLPLDKAGSYGIQDKLFSPAERVSGCYLNVVGLPVCLTGDLLSMAGFDIDIDCDDCDKPLNTVSMQS